MTRIAWEEDPSSLLGLWLSSRIHLSTLNDSDMDFHLREYERLRAELQGAHEASLLPELPSDEARAGLNELLLKLRLGERMGSVPTNASR